MKQEKTRRHLPIIGVIAVIGFAVEYFLYKSVGNQEKVLPNNVLIASTSTIQRCLPGGDLAEKTLPKSSLGSCPAIGEEFLLFFLQALRHVRPPVSFGHHVSDDLILLL